MLVLPHRVVSARALVLLTSMIALLATGCGVQQQLDECQSRLTASEAEKGRLEQDLVDLRTDYKEVLRGWGVAPDETSVTEGVLQTIEGRIEEVKSSVADQVSPVVQEQLELQLGVLAMALEKEFNALDSKNARLSAELGEVRGSLAQANRRLEGIEQTGSDIQTELVAQQIDEGLLDQELEMIAKLLDDFDESHFLCRDCEDFLNLKRKRQDVLVAFHADLRSALRRVPAAVIRPAGAAGTGELESAPEGDGPENAGPENNGPEDGGDAR